MRHEVDLIVACADAGLPTAADFRAWAGATLASCEEACSVAVRIVGEDESRELSSAYRSRDKPTNVLSFPAEIPAEVLPELGYLPLGDLAICAPVVHREAGEQGKPVRHHWAHLTVHGILHLLGLDHADPAEARIMESRECAILAGLGIPDPYAG